ncbi:secreted RxLR effector protein 161-like [Diprion similis]|uniref:secreted RxLR effector protein 161-like n=1 Tax=Diprion similis TaxID=362088 RepID=UPI001EF84965|nr:secreted RxLR effector protein 161-like [Diprion similis]
MLRRTIQSDRDNMSANIMKPASFAKVGSLVFLATVSRPDIAFAVNAVSKYLSKHNTTHWRAVKRIFAYLKGTIKYGIEYASGGSKAELIGFSHADYAGDIETRRSTTGYFFCFANGAVTWLSQRQRPVTLSTTKAEYVAASTAAREALWIKKLLSVIRCPCDKETSLYVLVNNQWCFKEVASEACHQNINGIRMDVEAQDQPPKRVEGLMIVGLDYSHPSSMLNLDQIKLLKETICLHCSKVM